MTIIREATAADVPRIVEMAGRFLATTIYGDIFRESPAHLTTYVEAIRANGVVFVADVGFGQLVGMHGLVGPVAHPFTGDLFLEEHAWWIEPEFRSGGLGKALLVAAEVWAGKKNIRMIKVGAPADSDVGRFFARAGYNALETTYVKVL